MKLNCNYAFSSPSLSTSESQQKLIQKFVFEFKVFPCAGYLRVKHSHLFGYFYACFTFRILFNWFFCTALALAINSFIYLALRCQRHQLGGEGWGVGVMGDMRQVGIGMN